MEKRSEWFFLTFVNRPIPFIYIPPTRNERGRKPIAMYVIAGHSRRCRKHWESCIGVEHIQSDIIMEMKFKLWNLLLGKKMLNQRHKNCKEGLHFSDVVTQTYNTYILELSRRSCNFQVSWKFLQADDLQAKLLKTEIDKMFSYS